MNYGLLLSGGIGSRIGANMPKQYVKAGGHMMVSYALMPLLKCEFIDKVYIVSEEVWRDDIVADVRLMGLDETKIAGFAFPGESRQSSILNGMEAMLEGAEGNEFTEDDTVLVHDGARPFLTEDMLNNCYNALLGHDGVMPVLPMKDTVYESADGRSVTKILEREKIYAGQAPELFRLRKYYEANKDLVPLKINEVNGATEPAIMKGMDVAMIMGDESNYKVTTKEDMNRFIRLKEGE